MTQTTSSGGKKGLALPALKRDDLIKVGALAFLLLGAWLAYLGAVGWVERSGSVDAQAERDRLAGQLGRRAEEMRVQFQGVLQDAEFRAAALNGKSAEAVARIQTLWPTLASVEIHPGNLDDLYAQGGEQVGFGKMAVLSEARVSDGVALQLVGSGSSMAVGLAEAVTEQEGEDAQAIAYGELSLKTFVDPVASVDPGTGFIELRGGPTRLAALGEEGLSGVAVSMPVPGTPFMVAAANPHGDEYLIYLALGAVGLLGGGGLFAWLRKHASPVSAVANEPTLAELAASARATPVAAPVEVKTRLPQEPARPKASLDRSIFRAYDIRGVVGKTLDGTVARLIGQAVGSLLKDKGLREIVVGRDGRLSGPELSAALIEGLRSTGCDVIDIGQAPTPVVYFASYQLHAGSCVAVTGSHNPPDYNGFKIVVGGETLSGDAITDLYARIAENRLHSGSAGGLQSMNVIRDYTDRIASDVQLERRLRVVVDCGNGVAGAVAPQVLEAIGCEAEQLYCDVDGTFPNHHPDPSEPSNLRDLITAVKRTGADLGLAFDGDGDRLGVVTASGKIIYPDRVLMLFAQDVLSRNPGAAIIYDVKCTGHLAGQILRHGGSPVMWKTGHSLIKAKMRETEAELAGEMSGHFFFRERWYGFDDGIYAAARLLEILAMDDRDAEEVFAELPDSVSTPELKVPMEEGEHYAFIEQFREKARFEGAKIFTIDGVRADWPDGWGLVRCSNTTPSLVLRFDAESESTLARVQKVFREQILAVRADLKLPF